MLKRLKNELLNEEMTLLEMDNIATKTTDGFSIFEYGKEYWGEYEENKFNFAYSEKYNIYFDIVEGNKNELDIIIKVIDIEEL